jgi:hypothetical protein
VAPGRAELATGVGGGGIGGEAWAAVTVKSQATRGKLAHDTMGIAKKTLMGAECPRPAHVDAIVLKPAAPGHVWLNAAWHARLTHTQRVWRYVLVAPKDCTRDYREAQNKPWALPHA